MRKHVIGRGIAQTRSGIAFIGVPYRQRWPVLRLDSYPVIQVGCYSSPPFVTNLLLFFLHTDSKTIIRDETDG